MQVIMSKLVNLIGLLLISTRKETIERFRDFHFTDRITYRQSVKFIRNLEFRASFAQLLLNFTFTYSVHHGNEKWRHDDFELASPTSGELRKLRSLSR